MMVMGVKGGHVTSDLFFTHNTPRLHHLSAASSARFPCQGARRTKAPKKTGFVAGLNRPIRKMKYFNKTHPHLMLSKVLKISGVMKKSDVIGYLMHIFTCAVKFR